MAMNFCTRFHSRAASSMSLGPRVSCSSTARSRVCILRLSVPFKDMSLPCVQLTHCNDRTDNEFEYRFPLGLAVRRISAATVFLLGARCEYHSAQFILRITHVCL